MLAGWGMGRAAGVKGTKKGKGQAQKEREAHLVRSNQHIQGRQMAWCSVRKSGGSRKLRKKRRLGGTRGVVTVSRVLQGCHMEEILLGSVASGHTGYTQLDKTF